jgi:hypothetical protein
MIITLKENSCFIRMPCLCCGDSFRLGIAAIEAHIPQEERPELMCEECLEAGADDMKESLKRRAKRLRAKANWLDDLAEQDFDVPTFEEYEKFCEQAGERFDLNSVTERNFDMPTIEDSEEFF